MHSLLISMGGFSVAVVAERPRQKAAPRWAAMVRRGVISGRSGLGVVKPKEFGRVGLPPKNGFGSFQLRGGGLVTGNDIELTSRGVLPGNNDGLCGTLK